MTALPKQSPLTSLIGDVYCDHCSAVSAAESVNVIREINVAETQYTRPFDFLIFKCPSCSKEAGCSVRARAA